MPDRKKIEKAWRTCQSGKDPCSKCHYVNERNCNLAMVADALQLLDEQPNIVRCKDCKYANKHCSYSVFGKPLFVCNHIRQIGREGLEIHTGDWFCADGERK